VNYLNTSNYRLLETIEMRNLFHSLLLEGKCILAWFKQRVHDLKLLDKSNALYNCLLRINTYAT